jgi:hypothetical protein
MKHCVFGKLIDVAEKYYVFGKLIDVAEKYFVPRMLK